MSNNNIIDLLINKFTVNNSKYSIQENNNNVIVKKCDEILNAEMHSFGIFPYINPFLYKNNFEATLEFNYKFSDKCNIKIYNGTKWLLFDNNSSSGVFKETIQFDNCSFTNFKPKWRIGFTNSINEIHLMDIKLLIISNDKPYLLLIGNDRFELNIESISDFNSINCYYLQKYLNKEYNVINRSQETLINNLNHLNFEVKYAIFTSLHGIIKYNANGESIWTESLFHSLYSKVDKILVSTDSVDDKYITDTSTFNNNCYFIPSMSLADNYKHKVCEVHWAADHEIFYPKKATEKFIILIDDCHYPDSVSPPIYEDGVYHKDYEILDYCIDLMNKNDFVYVYRFGFGDKNYQFVDKYKNKYDRYVVIEEKIPILEKAEFHNISNVFWCTHYETLGLPNIESAMSDCLLIHPKGFVKKTLTQYLDNIDYTDINEITLDIMMNKFIPGKQREKAIEFTWEKKCEKILNYLR
jgi:hypothetical protein